MSLLIFDSHPLVVDKKLAKIIGLNQAMILQQVHYWLEINKKNKRNFHEGRYWTYNTINDWQEEFPFWSADRRTDPFKDEYEKIIYGVILWNIKRVTQLN